MQIINTVKIETILFLDIETAPNWLEFKDVPENVRTEWIYKFKFRPDAPKNNEDIFDTQSFEDYFAELWKKEAGLYPEFSRVVCISAGFMYQGAFYMRSYYDQNEGTLLTKFKADLQAFEVSANYFQRLCAHYGKGFDFPFMAKRMLINRIALPKSLDVAHLKPWEQLNLDTQEIWKFGGFGNSAGLPALCMAFGLETPKDDLDGSRVAAAFHAGELDRIAVYCEKDVFALLNVFKAMRLEEPITEAQIVKR
jgi:predicted PolB exonuclease-like 3'-5' exonuclease